MSFFGNHPPNNALEKFDTELQYFYKELLSTVSKTKKLKKMKKVVLESLKQNKMKHIHKLNSKASIQNTAYIFRYGPCYTSAVTNHMVRVIKDNPFIFREALWKRCVNICCFGTAPVSALCKVFSFAQELFWESTRKPLQINVTIVDNNRGEKKSTTSNVLQALLKTNNILDPSKITVRVQRVKAEPAKLQDSSMVEVLKEADIVTMVKFVSAIRVKTVMEQFISEVADSMKVGSLLFFLDTGLIQHYQLLQNVIQPLNDFQCINGPNIKEPFTLSIESIQKSVELYWSRFQGNICLTSCLVNSCAWLKSDTKTKQNETESSPKLSRKARQEKASKAKREWCERALKSQKILEDFHQKVRQILPKKKDDIEGHEEDGSCFLLDYPKHEENVLFKNKSKERRIYLDDRVDFSVA